MNNATDIGALSLAFTVNIMALFGEIVNAVLAAAIGIMSLIYLYYKIKNERRKNREGDH